MESRNLIDAQFDRAVEIVQGLPKTGPIQTDYEEKLTMYSLYKQATVGNVKSPRPGIWDMLGRAKWDAWAKHKDLESYEAKWLYVEALLKVLRKYSDKTIAQSLVQELESYAGDTSNIVISTRCLSRSSGSSSGSTTSDVRIPIPADLSPARLLESSRALPTHHFPEESEEETEDEVNEIQPQRAQIIRPQSSVSSRRYRTPLAGSRVSPGPGPRVPSVQPMPGFETPSAFVDLSSSTSPPAPHPYPGQYLYGSRTETLSPPTYPLLPPNRENSVFHHGSVPRAPLEVAVENMQTYLAALTERLDMLEASINANSSVSSLRLRSSNGASPAGRGSPADNGRLLHWDLDDLGMWSWVLRPISNCLQAVERMSVFFASDHTRSPTRVVVRRLVLDASFVLCVLTAVKLLWRRSGMRRREVYAALIVLCRALFGTRRALVERGL
jgi:acyl-CoA-binding protein